MLDGTLPCLLVEEVCCPLDWNGDKLARKDNGCVCVCELRAFACVCQVPIELCMV